ncbi:metallopeptidase family protein [Iodidimonas sp. SYSU 1G8]|uniref:metallopeptidase family protein n=1 Tax=Iodidimonas sp. SYSU 1G8 TaxID=3133967 RepID=UPI0031FEDE72
MDYADDDYPSLEDFEIMARDAFETLPAQFRERCEGVAILIEDFPDDEVCRDMELESPWDLLGLYEGVNLLEKASGMTGEAPDVIFLYREPIMDYWDEGEREESLRHIIAHVLIHEIGHHFGFSDEDMERIEEAARSGED